MTRPLAAALTLAGLACLALAVRCWRRWRFYVRVRRELDEIEREGRRRGQTDV